MNDRNRMNDPAALGRFIADLPKAEIHVHLEGAIRPATLLKLARRHGVSLPSSTAEGLQSFFRFRNFDAFLKVYLMCSSCLREPEDFQLVVDDFLGEQERQNVLYTEAYFTVSTHIANGVNAGEVADAMLETIRENRRRRGVTLRLVPDIVRNVAPERADQTLEWALQHREELVAALGIAGKETSPPEPFREHFREAERQGLRRVAHAGEQTNAEDVWRVLEVCRPLRVGHGIRSVDDPQLVAELVKRSVPLEICASSNVCLGYAETLEKHPVRDLHARGVPFSVNSDDPAFFDTTLNREYREVARLLDLTPGEVIGLSRSALAHAFVEGDERRRLEREFDERAQGALEMLRSG